MVPKRIFLASVAMRPLNNSGIEGAQAQINAVVYTHTAVITKIDILIQPKL